MTRRVAVRGLNFAALVVCLLLNAGPKAVSCPGFEMYLLPLTVSKTGSGDVLQIKVRLAVGLSNE
jgi:hypothetical protein